jgi:hypothetical protein
MMRTSSRLLAVLGALALTAPLGVSPAWAQPSDNQAKAEKAYLEADALFQVRKYDEAAKKFIEAYEAWPDTEFLYNIAQAYRLAENCGEALYFYQRFKKLKKRDDGKELSESDPKRAEKVDRFITELEACVKQTKSAKDQQPDDITRPDKGKTTTPPPKDTTPPKDDKGKTVAVVPPPDQPPDEPPDEPDDEPDDDLLLEEEGAMGAKTVSARAVGGIAMIGAGDLDVPVQPSFVVGAGYPLAAGPVFLDVGAAITYSPLPYRSSMDTSETSTLLAVLANVGVTYPVNDKIGARVDGGLGVLTWGGLGAGNPFTEGGAPTDGTLGMFHLRLALAADYAITDNIVATVTPLSFAFSPAKTGLDMGSVTNLSFLLGIGYRM